MGTISGADTQAHTSETDCLVAWMTHLESPQRLGRRTFLDMSFRIIYNFWLVVCIRIRCMSEYLRVRRKRYTCFTTTKSRIGSHWTKEFKSVRWNYYESDYTLTIRDTDSWTSSLFRSSAMEVQHQDTCCSRENGMRLEKYLKTIPSHGSNFTSGWCGGEMMDSLPLWRSLLFC